MQALPVKQIFFVGVKDNAGAWASELVLGTRFASVILHGCSTVASAVRSLHGVVNIGVSVPVFKRGIVLVDAGLALRRLALSSSSEDQLFRPPLLPFADNGGLCDGARG